MKTTMRTYALVLVSLFASLALWGCSHGGGGGGGGGGGSGAPSAPTIVSADAIQYAAGTINFTSVVSNGDVVQYEYGIGAFTASTAWVSTTTPVVQVTGLTEGATYQYRAVSNNTFGVSTTGATQTVVVNTHAAPTVTTGGCVVGVSGVTLSGYVNPKGLDTTYWFQYMFINKATGATIPPTGVFYTTATTPVNVTGTYYDTYTVSAEAIAYYPIGSGGTYYLEYILEAQNSSGLTYGTAVLY